MTETKKPHIVTHEQFKTVLLRWMNEGTSAIPEGMLVASIFSQAWLDGSSWFFRAECNEFKFYCRAIGVNPEFLEEIYTKHNINSHLNVKEKHEAAKAAREKSNRRGKQHNRASKRHADKPASKSPKSNGKKRNQRLDTSGD
jgi:hypothetical protein